MTHQALLLFTITGLHVGLFALISLAIIGVLYQWSVSNKFNSLDKDLDGMLNVRTSKLSYIGTVIAQSIEVVQEGRKFAEEITQKITSSRLPGPNELFRVLTEAQIPINENLFNELLPTIQGLWSQLEEFETAIQGKVVSRNTMLVTKPVKWFISGAERQIAPIVTSEASEMASSGVLTTKPLFPKA